MGNSGLNGLEWAHAEWAVTKGHPSERRQINSMAQEAASPGHPTLVRANSGLGTLREDKDTSPLILRRSQSLVGCRSPARVLNISCPRTRAASELAKTGGNARGDMSSQQMVMYRDDFRQYDVDKSGALSPDELKAVLSKQLKRDPSDAEFAAFMKQIDVNEDGKVTLEEYVKWLHGDNWHVDGVPGREQLNRTVCPKCSHSWLKSDAATSPVARMSKMSSCPKCNPQENPFNRARMRPRLNVK